jgi:tetratricopeptide (TPR) repeat protein
VDRGNRGGWSTAVEWGWLFLIVAVPWVYTSAVYNSFTAPKVALFRGIVEGMAVAALFSDGRARCSVPDLSRRLRNRPFALALLAYALVLGMATLAGRNPSSAFWGLYLRWMGAFTLMHGIALAALVSQFLRREEQLRRLLCAVALGSMPVVGLALAQRFGWETSHWLGNDDVRVRSLSTLGNASLLGSYLVWVLPFTAAWTLAGRGTSRRLAGLVLVVVQLAALATTMTRGAWLGALAAGSFFVVLWLWQSGRRRAALGGLTGLGALLGAVALLNLSPSVADRFRSPVVHRLANLVETDPTSSGGSRLLYWRGVLSGTMASLPALLLGHGPQSFLVVHSRRYMPVEADLGEPGQYPDSSHNMLLDTLNDTGLLGVAAWLGLLLVSACLAARVLRGKASELARAQASPAVAPGFRSAKASARGLEYLPKQRVSRGIRRAEARRHLRGQRLDAPRETPGGLARTRRAAAVAILAALAGYLVQGQFLFEHLVSHMFLALTMGLAASPLLQGDNPAEVRETVLEPARAKKTVTVPATLRAGRTRAIGGVVAVVALAAAVYFGSVRPLLADHLILRAEAILGGRSAPTGGETSTAGARALLERAASYAPWEPTYLMLLAKLDETQAVFLRETDRREGSEVQDLFDAAEAHLLRAVKQAPGDLRVLYPLGSLYQLWGESDPSRFSAAERVYAEAAAISPRRQRTYWLWGDLLLAQGKRDAAEAMYLKALELDPGVAASHGAMAMLYDRLSRPEEAERYRRQARALRPTALVIVPHAPPGSTETSTPIP